MRLDDALCDAAADAGLTLAISLLAALPHERADIARQIRRRNAWLHADVIDGRFGSRDAVTLAEIALLAAPGPERIDVHLMVDNPVAWCSRLPPVQRVTVQLHDGVDLIAAAAAARAVAPELWWAVDPAFASGGRLAEFLRGGCGTTDPDGLLVMLTPPGQAGFVLDTGRIDDLRIAGDLSRATGVDGGVTLAHLPAIGAAGAGYAVCGRASMQPHPHQQIAIDKEPTHAQ